MNKQLLIVGILAVGAGLVLAQQANAQTNNRGGYVPYTPQQEQQSKTKLQSTLDKLSPALSFVKNIITNYINQFDPAERTAMERILKNATSIPQKLTDTDYNDYKILKAKYPALGAIGFILGL